MTKNEHAEARGELLSLLDRQPNLLGSFSPNREGGTRLAEAYWNFMEAYARLKKDQVQG